MTDQVWGREMKRAAAPGALLDGGDWGEGWQYGPLAVAGYALAARAMIEQGVPLPEYQRWAEQVVLRQVHSLSPNDKGIFVGGDTQAETASLPPNPWTLTSMLAGPTPETSARWARAEIDRLHLVSDVEVLPALRRPGRRTQRRAAGVPARHRTDVLSLEGQRRVLRAVDMVDLCVVDGDAVHEDDRRRPPAGERRQLRAHPRR